MIVTLADFKTDPDRYLELVGSEEIILSKEGRHVARLTRPPQDKLALLESLCGILSSKAAPEEVCAEKLERLHSLIGTLPPTATLEEARAERLARHEAGL